VGALKSDSAPPRGSAWEPVHRANAETQGSRWRRVGEKQRPKEAGSKFARECLPLSGIHSPDDTSATSRRDACDTPVVKRRQGAGIEGGWFKVCNWRGTHGTQRLARSTKEPSQRNIQGDNQNRTATGGSLCDCAGTSKGYE
jgi:hypothetical protein